MLVCWCYFTESDQLLNHDYIVHGHVIHTTRDLCRSLFSAIDWETAEALLTFVHVHYSLPEKLRMTDSSSLHIIQFIVSCTQNCTLSTSGPLCLQFFYGMMSMTLCFMVWDWRALRAESMFSCWCNLLFLFLSSTIFSFCYFQLIFFPATIITTM